MARMQYVTMCACVACMTSSFVGFNLGVMNGATVYIKELKGSHDEVETFTGGINIASLIGVMFAAWMLNRVGRRQAILSSSAIFLLGRFILGWTRNYYILMVGRVITNIGFGNALVITPIYIAEVSPALCRGKLTSLVEVFLNGAMVAGNICNYVFSNVELSRGWHIMLLLGVLCSYALTLGILAMPESPRWLIMRGRVVDAGLALEMICDSNQEATLQLIELKRANNIPLERNDNHVEVTQEGFRDSMGRNFHSTRCCLHMLMCIISMHLFRQISGTNTIIYNPQILEEASITDSDIKVFITIGVELLKILCMICSTCLVDSKGRRLLILSSISGMILSLVFQGMLFKAIDKSTTELTQMTTLSITLAVFYEIFFSIGLSPVTTVYCTEIFPARLRAEASAIGVGLAHLMSGLSSKVYLCIFDVMSFGGAAFFMATVSFIMWVAFYVNMPETRGLRLEDIGRLFGHISKWREAMMEIELPRISRVDSDATTSRSSGPLLHLSNSDIE